MSWLPGRKGGDGKRPAQPQPQPQPQQQQPQAQPAPVAPQAPAPPPPQQVRPARVLDVGPPLVPRQPSAAPAPPAPPPPQSRPQGQPARAARTGTLAGIPAQAPPPPSPSRPSRPPRTGTLAGIPPQAPAPAPPPPPAAAPQPAAGQPGKESLWDSVDGLLDDVDAGFGAIMGSDGSTRGSARPAAFQSPSGGLSNARALFTQLATAHVRHVRDFMIDVKAGQATTEWLTLCEPAVRSVREMAGQLELRELCGLLDAYLATLRLAAEVSAVSVDGEARTKLLAAYEPLIAAMPEAFSLDAVKIMREGVIVQALLLQIPDVRKVTIDKLYAAGLTTLDAFFVARPDEIAATTGLDAKLAETIVERFQRHREEMQGAAVDDSRSFEHARLTELGADLARHHRDFEQADKDDDGPRKREARKARETAFLEIKVLLARLGEVERVSALDRLPFSQKVAELTNYLQEAGTRPKS